MGEKLTIWTIGHSTREWGEFVAILKEFEVATLCDIRSLPGSRKFPQFNSDAMSEALARESIAYVWMGKGLGGRRSRGLGETSPNKGFRSRGFRNYADYMQSDAFRQALDDLIALAGRSRTAIMCAEILYFRCHRWLVSDALTARGIRVVHIQDRGKASEHQLSHEARVADGTVTYPGE